MLQTLLRRYLKSADEDSLKGACLAACEFAEVVRPYAYPGRHLTKEVGSGHVGRSLGDGEVNLGPVSPHQLAGNILSSSDIPEEAWAAIDSGHEAPMEGDGSSDRPDGNEEVQGVREGGYDPGSGDRIEPEGLEVGLGYGPEPESDGNPSEHGS